MATKKEKTAGRPTKLTLDLQNELIDLLKEDNYFETACWAVGITPKTGYNWLKRGEKDSEERRRSVYREFYDAVKRADAEAEITDIAYIKAGNPNWQARAWIRERRSRLRWGRQQIELTGKDGTPLPPSLNVQVVSESARAMLQEVVEGKGTEHGDADNPGVREKPGGLAERKEAGP